MIALRLEAEIAEEVEDRGVGAAVAEGPRAGNMGGLDGAVNLVRGGRLLFEAAAPDTVAGGGVLDEIGGLFVGVTAAQTQTLPDVEAVAVGCIEGGQMDRHRAVANLSTRKSYRDAEDYRLRDVPLTIGRATEFRKIFYRCEAGVRSLEGASSSYKEVSTSRTRA
jgi:hypothetical protein